MNLKLIFVTSLKHDYIRFEVHPLDHKEPFLYGFKVGSTLEELQGKVKLSNRVLINSNIQYFVNLDCGGVIKQFWISQDEYKEIERFILGYPGNVAHLFPVPIVARKVVNAIMEIEI